MKKVLVLCLLLCSMIAGVACGGQEALSNQTAVNPATAVPPTQPAPIEPAADDDDGCEDYFRFCTHVQISGSLTADFKIGIDYMQQLLQEKGYQPAPDESPIDDESPTNIDH